jgi:hypothetical protein
LFGLLDGLPLGIAQAGVWRELMESRSLVNTPLQHYLDHTVWTTWAISYYAIRDKHKATANLLLLRSFLDHRDL